MKTDLVDLEDAAASMQSHRDDQGSYAVISKHEVAAVVSAIAELRAARAVVEAAHKVTDGATEWYLKQRPWEQTLAEALLAYDKVVGL